MDTVLEVDSVQADIGQFNILQSVSFTVLRNSVTVLLGRNGAGKTTTLRTIMGFIPVKAGRIQMGTTPLLNVVPHRMERLGFGYVPEDRNIFPNLSVEENLILSAGSAGKKAGKADSLAYVLDIFPDLKAAYKRLGGNLSGGQRQMLAVASALVLQPSCLLIDEPSKGLSPLFVDKLREVLADLMGTTTILLVEQNFYLAAAVGERYVLLDDGRTVAQGQMEELISDATLQQRYLGIRVAEGGTLQ